MCPDNVPVGATHAEVGSRNEAIAMCARSLIHGARAVVQRAANKTDAHGRWMWDLRRRKGTNVAAVAVANKHARVIWALLAHDDVYRRPA